MNTLNTGSAVPASGARIVGGYGDHSGPGPELMTASTLTGDEVVNRIGDKLGKIDEIMLDVRSGRIAYAVMASGTVLGLGGKLFAIPWSSLELDADRHCFVLDAPKERFKDAPGFDKDHWPSYASDTQWHRDVHTYYNAERNFWE
jgi:sporulation protein YlmC with PRC-barrel domain